MTLENRLNTQKQDVFLTVAEIADLLRVSNMTVYRLINANELSAIRVGKSYRLTQSDLDKYLADRYIQAG
ncbi:MAG: helix-turn-helix domain-containing protein [Actinobacteria bacterium]|nr:helix-turn-helix domain-containing protein [Actinomycetota bacterium]MCL6104501.1 helix-turn-helix domain-containing protein [Actinomycetota bacterium]